MVHTKKFVTFYLFLELLSVWKMTCYWCCPILNSDDGSSRCSWKLALTDTSTRPQILKLSYS